MKPYCGLISRYSRYLPITKKTPVVTLLEGNTPLIYAPKVSSVLGSNIKVYLKYEGLNPTSSFKDRGMTMAISKAKEAKTKAVICASTGNTSSSASAFAANELDMEALILVGAGKIAKSKLAQTLAYGAKVVQVKGDFDDAMAMVKELATEKGIYIVNSLNPFRLEGQKTMMYRMLDYLNWKVPEWIVFPGGNLGNTSAFGKAFMELYDYGWIKKKPRIAVVNADGAATLYELYNKREVRWNKTNHVTDIIKEYYSELDRKNIKAETKASAIEILKPVKTLF